MYNPGQSLACATRFRGVLDEFTGRFVEMKQTAKGQFVVVTRSKGGVEKTVHVRPAFVLTAPVIS